MLKQDLTTLNTYLENLSKLTGKYLKKLFDVKLDVMTRSTVLSFEKLHVIGTFENPVNLTNISIDLTNAVPHIYCKIYCTGNIPNDSRLSWINPESYQASLPNIITIEYLSDNKLEVSVYTIYEDEGGIVNETDPTVPAYVKSITQEQINAWDNIATPTNYANLVETNTNF